ncbi:MAG: serine protease [Gammaproteobacteria bacterium]|nr:serine protease [Gammaproteobacteria bacterium]
MNERMGFATGGKLSPMLAAQLAATGVTEAVVVLRQPAAAAHDPVTVAAALSPAFVIDPASPAQAVLRAVRPTAASVRCLATAGAQLVDGGTTAAAARSARASVYPALGILIGDVCAEGAARLAADERVEYVASAVPFSLVRPIGAASARLSEDTTWGIRQLGIPRLWAAGLDGSGVLVGHLDTGADSGHPALAGAIARFLYIDHAGFPGRRRKARDTDEHGTHTAATIAGRAVRGRSVGVAPGAQLVVATVIEGGDAARRIVTGLNWAVLQGVRIVSLSLGFRGYVADLYPIMQRLRERGVLPVVAVGNEGPGTSRSPGNYDLVVSVGASDARRRVAGFSSSQKFRRDADPIVPDLVAPGVDVISAVPGGKWMMMSGSSMATPHVAGLAALLWQAKPEASVAQIEAALFASARRGRTMSAERTGRGLVDGPRACAALTGQKLPAARPRRRAPLRPGRRGARQRPRISR